MFGKLMSGAAVATTVLALAAPAHASGESRARWASFGNAGGVMLMPTDNGSFIGEADFAGLKQGEYLVTVSQDLDYNHDGIADSGSTNNLCTLKVRHNQKTEMCRGNAGPLLGTGDWSDINRAELYRIERKGNRTNYVSLGYHDFIAS
jgi:hypothetical protein